MKKLQRIAVALLAAALMGSFLSIPAMAAEREPVSGIGFITASALNLRSQPNTASSSLASALKDECVVVLGKQGDWYQVSYNLQEGYMHSSFLRFAEAENAELGYGTVNADAVNLRYGPDLSQGIANIAPKGDKCYILGVNRGWYKVIYQSDICYIRSDFLDLTEIPYENHDSTNTPRFFRQGVSTGTVPCAAALQSSAAPSGEEILDGVKKCLGAPYAAGGADLRGFDCSGLVHYVLKNLGMAPGRTPPEQYALGAPVEKADLAPGDLVFFSGTGSSGISHVGIYSGDGQFIHAPNSGSRVSYSDLTTGYWSQHYYGARRIS